MGEIFRSSSIGHESEFYRPLAAKCVTLIELSSDTEHMDGVGWICCKAAVFLKTPADEGAHHVVARIDASDLILEDWCKPALCD